MSLDNIRAGFVLAILTGQAQYFFSSSSFSILLYSTSSDLFTMSFLSFTGNLSSSSSFQLERV